MGISTDDAPPTKTRRPAILSSSVMRRVVSTFWN
jgi:hypothetical protein